MQVPAFTKYKPGPIAEMAVRLYADASQKPFPSAWAKYPAEAEGLISVLMRGAPFTMPGKVSIDPVAAPDGWRVVVGFSGGKDSAAATLKLAADGLKPVLFHVKGVNRAYPNEWQAAEKVAALLGFPLLMLDLKLKGDTPYIENPAKNQFILGCMVDYGARHGIANYSQGGMAVDSCADLNFEAGFSDGHEMFDAATGLFGALLDGYRYRAVIKNDSDSLMTIARKKPAVISAMQSCMMPLRYKGSLAKANEKKFGIRLMPGRCGSCYKCASEYLHLTLAGLLKNSPSFAEHCVDVMVKAMPTIYGPGRYSRRDAILAFIDISLLPGAERLCY